METDHDRPRAVSTAIFAAREASAADPTTIDCLSATEGSLKLRSEHKLRSARAQLLVCASPSCPADIRTECARRVDEVNVAIPTSSSARRTLRAMTCGR